VACAQLVDRPAGQVHTGQIEPCGDHRQQVAAVAAPDVETRGDAPLPGRRDDIPREGDRRLALVPAGRVLGVPGRGGRGQLLATVHDRSNPETDGRAASLPP
jgi:hypothetical protein